MKVEIKDNIVYKEDLPVGKVRKFCCGVDLMLNEYPKAYFSILQVRIHTKSKLLTAVKALLSIKIPDKRFHWNFSYNVAKDKAQLKDYEERLNAL